MAWRSSGTTNEEMVDNLKRFGVIRSPQIEAAFRDVDRAHFCPQNLVAMAYWDQPLREGDIHLSAPHMYGTIVEQLDLMGTHLTRTPPRLEESSMSVLNVGSGTGYLSCIIARLLSKSSVLYGIELQREVLDHCLASIDRWKTATNTNTSSRFNIQNDLPHMEFVLGNGLHIDSEQGESIVGYDRIYVGSSIDQRALTRLAAMLRLGGILIAPVDDELIKIVRIKQTKSSLVLNRSQNNPMDVSDDFNKEVLSAVRFAALAKRPRIVSVVPSRVWGPENHKSYPKSFQNVCKTILLCSSAPMIQPPDQPSARLNLASKLPKLLWMEILSFTHHSWFEQSNTSVELLQMRLAQEQSNAIKAADSVRKAEQRIRVLERERDGYRMLALRWQARFQELAGAQQQSDSTTFALLMEAIRNEPPLLDDNHTNNDDEDGYRNADDNVYGTMESSDEDEEEESSGGSSEDDDDDDDDSLSVFMQDEDGEGSGHDERDNFSVSMDLSINNGLIGRTTRTVSISSNPSP